MSTSSNCSPHSTQTFERLDEEVIESAPDATSDLRFVPLNRGRSESFGHMIPLSFTRNQSQERTSITSESLRPYLRQQRSDSRVSADDHGTCFCTVCGVEDSLPLLHPQPTSSSVIEEEEEPQLACGSSRQHLAGPCEKKRENFHSDSAISSTSENEEMSSIESVADYTANSTTSTLDAGSPSSNTCPMHSETASTTSTIHVTSYENSGSSIRTPASPVEDAAYSQVNVEVRHLTVVCVQNVCSINTSVAY